MSNKLFPLLVLASGTSLFATTYGAGPSVTCYSDSGYTLQVPCTVQSATRLYMVFGAPATATLYGTTIGTLSPIDATHASFLAPAVITPVHQVSGLQPLPSNDLFFTRIDALPTLSQHYVGDGSMFCRYDATVPASMPYPDTRPLCAGDPTLGTGYYKMVGAPGDPIPGGPNDAHVGSSSENIVYGATSTATVLDGTEPLTWNPVFNYGGSGGPLPDLRYRFNWNRQAGMFSTIFQNCNIVTGNDSPNPRFPGCAAAPAPMPFPGTASEADHHTYEVSPSTMKTYEMYDDLSLGTSEGCQSGASGCTIQSFRALDWTNFGTPAAMGLAGTPENQLELTGEDLWTAADGIEIQHQLVGSMPSGYYRGNFTYPAGSPGSGHIDHPFIWPATGPCSNCTTSALPTVPVLGQRFRLSTTRTSMTKGAWGVTVTNAGSGYTPGQVLQLTISGCTSIDGVHPASGISFVGPGGSIENNSGYYAWITNTGTNCTSPTVSFPAPTSGTTATGTVATMPTFNNATTAGVLYRMLSRYGYQIDDTCGGCGMTFRTDNIIYNAPTYSTLAQMLPGATARTGFSNMLLWDPVDQSSLATNWGAGSGTNLWAADNANTYEGSTVQNAIVVKLTATTGGATSYTPIPALGTAVGFYFGNQIGRFNILSGAGSVDLSRWAYVTGDPTHTGLTWQLVTDPCPGVGGDTLSGSVYTPCPAYNGTAIKSGLIRVTSNFNAFAYTYVQLQVGPVDSAGSIRIDSAGSGGSDANGNTWSHSWADQMLANAGIKSEGAWSYARFPSIGAPTSIPSEAFLYQSYEYGDDYTVTMYVPNGHYRVRFMTGQNYNGASGQKSNPDPSWHGWYIIDTQGTYQFWNACLPCVTANQYAQPVDFIVPATVTDNVLRVGLRGTNQNRWVGWSPFTPGGAPNAGTIGAVAFYHDTTTTPYWELHNYTPNSYNLPDMPIQPSVGRTSTVAGALPPGVVQFYIRDWYTGLSDPTWKLISGPGTLSTTGLYVAPTTMPAGNHCAVVKAQSISTPSVSATQNVCIGGTSMALK